jgi:hypothetical protein
MARGKTYYRNPTLAARKAHEWAQMIEDLPEHLRAPVARLVWWDYFGDRLVPNRSNLLDKYLQTTDEPDLDEWVQALIDIGYDANVAALRIGAHCRSFRRTIEEEANRRARNYRINTRGFEMKRRQSSNIQEAENSLKVTKQALTRGNGFENKQ